MPHTEDGNHCFIVTWLHSRSVAGRYSLARWACAAHHGHAPWYYVPDGASRPMLESSHLGLLVLAHAPLSRRAWQISDSTGVPLWGRRGKGKKIAEIVRRRSNFTSSFHQFTSLVSFAKEETWHVQQLCAWCSAGLVLAPECAFLRVMEKAKESLWRRRAQWCNRCNPKRPNHLWEKLTTKKMEKLLARVFWIRQTVFSHRNHKGSW